MIIKLNESNGTSGLYAISNCPDPDPYSTDFWGWDIEYDVGYELVDVFKLIPDADIFDSIEAAEQRSHDILDAVDEDEVFIIGLDAYFPHNPTGFAKKITRELVTESKSINDGLKEEIECTIQAGKNRATGSKLFNVFPQRNTEFFKKFQNAIKSKSIDVTHFPSIDSAKEFVKDFCAQNGFNYNDIKWIIKESLETTEDKSIKEAISPNTMKEIKWLLDGIIDIGLDDKINDQDDWKRLYTTALRIKKQLNKEDIDEDSFAVI